ncbi:hypothetical protein B0H14DRAFT_2814828 [Mycena olivaceomarginata]|nr:hypothetical protein B0H14DRAFT_2814828 [Mycena olivaceomarginata]
MAYKPAVTSLLLLALAQKAGENWAAVRGLDVLLEQGYVQFELWTGCVCPKGVVAEQVRAWYVETVG